MGYDDEDGALEDLIGKLKSGEATTRKSRRRRQNTNPQRGESLSLTLAESAEQAGTTRSAKDMLESLKTSGFVSTVPSSTTPVYPDRRTRRQQLRDDLDLRGSPLAQEISMAESDSEGDETEDAESSSSPTPSS